MAPHTDTSFIEAIRRRDPAYDRKFVFGVATTGLYCKPSCPSRPARAENITFYSSPAEAEKAGFRSCKRCRPDHVAGTDPHIDAITRACALIASSKDTPSLQILAAEAGLSMFQFHRTFKKINGVMPKAFAAQERAKRAQSALLSAESVTEAIYDAGFSSPSRFYETAHSRLGMTPTNLRAGGKGETIRFALRQTTLGTILVAAADTGICAISLGSDPEKLLRDLQYLFPCRAKRRRSGF